MQRAATGKIRKMWWLLLFTKRFTDFLEDRCGCGSTVTSCTEAVQITLGYLVSAHWLFLT